MIYASKSDIGQRKRNEDAFCLPKFGDAVPFVAVSDGMGGHRGGAIASRLVVEGLQNRLALKPWEDPVPTLCQAIQSCNDEINETALRDASLSGMGATLVAALLYPAHYLAVNIGDSRLYHFHNQQLVQVTEDHSYVACLVKEGIISPEEALHHPNRNLITRCMGSNSAVEPDFFECTWHKDDILLLCSDGLSGSVSNEAMIRILTLPITLDAMCDRLVEAALAKGASDNITVLLVKNAAGAVL